MLRVKDVIGFLEVLAPPHLAEDWDEVGLQIGDPDRSLDSVLLALDPSLEALHKAKSLEFQLIVTHHPLFFKPLKRLHYHDPVTQFVKLALEHDIAVFSAHTNLDATSGGVNDVLARLLGIEVQDVLAEEPSERMAKLVVFVPGDFQNLLRQAIFSAGGGRIGKYSGCSFNLPGAGTYTPMEGAAPFEGKVGVTSEADEVRIEVLVPRDRIREAVAKAREVHPYEEMAYDVIPLLNPTHSGGTGRWGKLSEPTTLEHLARRISERLGLERIKCVGDRLKPIRTVALCGGSGASLYPHALRKGADVFITGEFTYHQALEASARGLALLDVGHFASERPVLNELSVILDRRFRPLLPEFRAVVFQEEKDVFQYI
ncbi:MAG: Nif3-like dinuclear metal center hexameric protein [Deltaproteobacteria bacterium]|nr:Nif3-like dinuclear metal center hexameric protein [Deltaproteobacteria bacterium]